MLPTMTLPPWTFGCVVYIHLHRNQHTKLDPCARRCLFLGYATNQKGYRWYDPTKMQLYVTLDVTFLETKMFYHPTNSSIQGETHNEESNWFKDIPLTTEPPTTMDMEQTTEPPTPTIETPTPIAETPPHSTIPHDLTSKNIPEEILEVSSPLVTKHLTNDGY